MTSQFGARLRQLRLRAGLTQEEMAARSGVGVRTIRGLETGERADPRMVTVRLLADALSLDIAERDDLLAVAIGKPGRALAPAEPVPAEEDPLAEAADQLAQAVRTRWQREEEHRRIHDPFPLPVRWQPVSDDLMDHWANIRRAPAGETAEPVSLDGGLGEIAEVYRRVPSGRLVVLGRAGAGKTILTLRFVLDRLADRGRADPVPVLFGLASWNPATTSLRDWLTGRLVRDHPGLAAPAHGSPTLAAALVDHGWILPVLDGFDELADGLHRPALLALNATTLPLLLTSRPTEFAAAVAGTDVLTAAAGVELTDLSPADWASYLPRSARKLTADDATVWDPILARLRDDPDSLAHLTAVLATPLMVVLARTIYSDSPGRDPGELLDTTRFPIPSAIEDHLLDDFVPTVYRQRPGEQRWDPDHAERWLRLLAAHLHDLGTRDLAWWQLGAGMRRSSRMLWIGLIVGLVNGLLNGVVVAFRYRPIDGLVSGLVAAASVGLAFGLAHGLVGGGALGEPSRTRIHLVSGLRQVRAKIVRRLLAGLAGGLAGGLVLGLTGGLGVELVGGVGNGFASGITSGLSIGLAGGVVFAIMAGLEAPADIRSAVSPGELLAANRTTVLVQLLVCLPVLAVGIGLSFGFADGVVFGVVVGSGLGAGYVLGLTAWGQWLTLSRLWLPLTGKLPWAVLAFLDDAYQRGVLRQAGAVYQFRHARLQDRLTYVR
ncbi:Transcriptional regulator, contains XRE-family HTH domain [Amycolatopsis xylanica]|uniref:Transcriptional regulator, contains XRE-family HTH domain n=1 Tax=Amycolatopsis xylanica TaxID=589385 RepID=A0A1H2S8A2_9PSEU|nr:helix-turn-helix transcriptional regulator [Amycolatopsis xylanica]SDW27725.1 Transcriptional regulator, contains XRE-family HTH domain [Amycolatopsis xylanica]